MYNSTDCIHHDKFIVDFLGYAGSFIFTIVMLPQLIKSFKTKSTVDISWFSIILNINSFSYLIPLPLKGSGFL